MRTQLFIENYELDITGDISSLLTFSIDDMKDFSARATTFSKTIILPGTANNNKIFGHIFQPGQANAYNDLQPNVGVNFNAMKSADCIIFQDQMQTFKGVLRLLQVNVVKGRMEYEVAVFGQLAGLNVALSSGLLEELDFSAYDHTYNETNIESSWDNAGGSGYYYPLIDYGQVSSDKHNFDLAALRPALYVKEYIDKMFDAAGFRYSSALFNTARFKSLIVPHNKKDLTKIQQVNLLTAGLTGNQTNPFDIVFDTITSSDFTLTNSNKNITYNTGTSKAGTVTAAISGSFYNRNIDVNIRKNGAVVHTESYVFSGSFPNFFSLTYSFPATFVATDYLSVDIVSSSSGSGATHTITQCTLTMLSDAAVDALIPYNSTININDILPKNVRQMDFLIAVIKLFNLYVYEDRNDTRLIYITPYVDFYPTDASDAVDWTYKVNRDKTIKVRPMSELTAKKYEFKYKQDSDYFNDLYRKRYGQGYGDYVFDSQYEFADASQSFEILFSATPLVGYTGEDKIYSTIFKQANGTEERTDSNLRILQSKKVTGVSSWDLTTDVFTLGSYTKYGYAGHLDDPDVPSNDLNFGALRELFFTLVSGDLSATQFNVYWSPYMAEITNKDSKLLTAMFYLNPVDIITLDFARFVYIDGVLYRLMKITDYNVSSPSDCEIQLLKIINLIY